MTKIAIVTATRAEYGLLSPVIDEFRKRESENFRVELIVTGTHLSEQYGMTISEIQQRIDHKIHISVESDTEQDISDNQAEALVKFTTLFVKKRYNAVVILGDRYETLAVAIAAGNTGTPIFHLYGGDTTEGAIDEWIRHSISKISYLHFVTNEYSRQRVIQLGEDPKRVFNFGATSIDNVLNLANMTKMEALDSVGLSDCSYALCTYHPVTLDFGDVESQIRELLEAIRSFPDIEFIITKSNADRGGARINKLLDEAKMKIENIHVYASLGIRRYLSLMQYSEFVIGNSSSGIIESPSFHIPTVNIGDRQRGRFQAESIINCYPNSKDIMEAINKALSKDFKRLCESVINPYGDGHSAKRIVEKSMEVLMSGSINLKKTFYDLRELE